MLYNRCTGIYKFGNISYPRCIRRRSNLGHILRGKKCVLWARKYGIYKDSVHTSQGTQCTSVKKTNQLILRREIMIVCCEAHKMT